MERPRWYVVAAENRKLVQAAEAVRAQGFQTFQPLVLLKPGLYEPLFRGYFFAAFDVDRHDWGVILRQPNVRRVLTMDNLRPTPVLPGVVERMIETAGASGVVLDLSPALIVAGAEVRFVKGPFADGTGRCLWVSEQRQRAMIELLDTGRRVSVPLSTLAARPAAPAAPTRASGSKAGRR